MVHFFTLCQKWNHVRQHEVSGVISNGLHVTLFEIFTRKSQEVYKWRIPVHGRVGWCCLMRTNDNRVCGCDVWQDPTGHLSSALDVPALLTTPCLHLETSQNRVLSGQSLQESPSLNRMWYLVCSGSKQGVYIPAWWSLFWKLDWWEFIREILLRHVSGRTSRGISFYSLVLGINSLFRLALLHLSIYT